MKTIKLQLIKREGTKGNQKHCVLRQNTIEWMNLNQIPWSNIGFSLKKGGWGRSFDESLLWPRRCEWSSSTLSSFGKHFKNSMKIEWNFLRLFQKKFWPETEFALTSWHTQAQSQKKNPNVSKAMENEKLFWWVK